MASHEPREGDPEATIAESTGLIFQGQAANTAFMGVFT